PCADCEPSEWIAALDAGGGRWSVEIAGPAAIRELRIVPTGDIDPGDIDVRIWWDDDGTPAVSGPMSLLFCAPDSEGGAGAAFFGRDERGFFLRYLMPYRKRARIELLNRGERTAELKLVAHIERGRRTERYGRLYTAISRQRTRLGEDFRLPALRGPARLVGLVAHLKGALTQGFLEGDEKIFIDRSKTPLVAGTGTEDFFNGAWYFNRGPFLHPLCGLVARRSHLFRRELWLYRAFLSDSVSFMDSLEFHIQHDWNNATEGELYEMLAYYYRFSVPPPEVVNCMPSLREAVARAGGGAAVVGGLVETRAGPELLRRECVEITDEVRIELAKPKGRFLKLRIMLETPRDRRKLDVIANGRLVGRIAYGRRAICRSFEEVEVPFYSGGSGATMELQLAAGGGPARVCDLVLIGIADFQ
ncbi:MAG TPA: DUF2961 domain-containing protein, partial [Proteobacteria bacterium]|nr:DUF2961 domain-containing protein [Pseudomonadota bacterium]